ncbi:MAG: IS110 family transposase [Actinomycetota bacterium]|nr:IS110 family transposase [Actinomycetota bacterium]
MELERKLVARELLEDWRWLDRRIPAAKQRLSDALTAYGTTLTDIHGIGEIGAATVLSIVHDPARFPSRAHFAAFNGTAPLEASSGDVRRHRLSRRGNRQLNKVIHVAARTQIRRDGPGRTYYERKVAEGNSRRESLRALKRQLSDVVYRRLLTDDRQRQAVQGGQAGTRPKSA